MKNKLTYQNGWYDEIRKLKAQDPLNEVDLPDEGEKHKPTYVNSLLDEYLKKEIIQIFREYKDFCFAWDYKYMHGLDRKSVERKLPLKFGKKPTKQGLRRFVTEVITKIKAEIKRLLETNTI